MARVRGNGLAVAGVALAIAVVALVAPSAGLARPSGVCTVTTLAATGISSSSATLNGSSAAGGARTFKWGLTAAYGNTTATNNGTLAYSATISGLSPSTTYHFAAACTGAPDGADLTFTTAALAASPAPGAESADLGVTMTAAPTTVTVGSQVTFTIVASHVSGAAALNALVTDQLPAALTLVSAKTTRGSCSGTATVSCALGTLVAGQSETITIVATAQLAGTLTSTAEIGATNPDPSIANNNRASAAVTVTSSAAPAAPAAPQAVTRTVTSRLAATRITGAVATSASAPACRAGVEVRLLRAVRGAPSAVVATTRTAADGSFVFARPRQAGSYAVAARASTSGGLSCRAASSKRIVVSAR